MSVPRSCPKCKISLTESSAEDICPRCGSSLVFPANDTPRDLATPNERDNDFRVGSISEDVTGSLLPETVWHEPVAVNSLPDFPDIPNHTDFSYITSGGMGKIYRAIQRPLNRVVAVKVMKFDSGDDELKQRFIREMRSQARNPHPNIVPIYEVGECSHGPYFTMEFLPGGPLSRLLRSAKLGDAEIVRMIVDATHGIHVAHEAGFVHRDIKPSNLLLDSEGRVKVADFGLAKPIEDEDLTLEGVIVGTLGYLSPEQASGDPSKVTKSSDIYSLGATLFQALTGRTAHRKPNRAATLLDILGNPSPRLAQYRSDICPTLEAIVMKSMAGEPSQRYETAALLAEDLENWLKGEPTVARPLTRGQKVRRFLHRNRVAVAAVLLLPFLAAGAAIVKRETDPKHQISRALERREKVLLVEKQGLPKWHAWDMGNAELTTTTLSDNSAGFQTQLYSMLRLVDDPMTDNYRVSMELRHFARGSGSSFYVGLYFGLEQFTAADETPLMRFVTVNFSDFWENIELQQDRAASQHRVLVRNVVLKKQNDYWPTSNGELWVRVMPDEEHPLAFVPVNNEGVWRKIVLDVQPTGVTVTWLSTESDPGRTVQYPVAVLDEMIVNPNKLRTTASGAPVIFSPWKPRRPLGILVSNSTATFRNVTIEPLVP